MHDSPNNNKPAEILVVDDVPENLQLLTSVLQQAEYKVYAAINGELALQALQNLQPDLILLDIKMPGMDGYEVCNKLKEKEKTREIPVIFISALDDPNDKVKAFSSGGVDYIGKPFQKEEVLARVNTHINLSRAQKALSDSRDHLESEVNKRTAELSNSERRLKQAQTLAHLGHWEFDLKNDKLFWSDGVFNIFGIDKNAFGASLEAFLERVHPDDQHMVKQAYQNAVKTKQSYDLTHRIIKKDSGEVRYVREHSDQILDDEGNPIRSFGTVQDITDLMTALNERQLYQDKFSRALEQTIITVAATLEKRDPYTAGHQRNVAYLAEAIAKEMGLPDKTIEGIRLGSSIHDIGKINIPAEILNRPGRLSSPEFEIIKTHPEQGFEILKNIEFPWPIAEMIHQHHERIDGTGYPKGLMEKKIILEAKILAVADVVEAMTSHRPYRPSVGLEPALKEIDAGKGIRYDGDVATACLCLFKDKGFKLESSM